jgi:nicotinamide-nucleotide amidase
MRVCILNVGTELTTGQILNENAKWISHKVYQYGFPISCHLVVPDDRKEILQALNYCRDHSEILFVTGGLGPTSDDFTREVIAEWCGTHLLFDEFSWHQIVDRLHARKVTVRESQRQQCYFPAGSKIIKNEIGTANAFALSFGRVRVFVLPGPPREIEAVWPEIDAELIDFSATLNPLITKSWETTGQGESEIAYLVEGALPGHDFEIGYRVHAPYVEVKLTYFKSKSVDAQKYADAIEGALKKWIVREN